MRRETPSMRVLAPVRIYENATKPWGMSQDSAVCNFFMLMMTQINGMSPAL
jgi:hypothetical protein